MSDDRQKTKPVDSPASSPASAGLPERLPYRPGREIARGGMGAVLDTQDDKFQRTVAMKVMLRGTNEESRRRFLQEARVLGQLAHPNIVPVHDLGVDEQGRLFYTMKLVKGVTLRAVLDGLKAGDRATVARYPLAQLLTVFQKICDALAFAHARGVIHRDLKPDNIMVGEFGEVLVMDWGLAKILPDSTASAALLAAEPAASAPPLANAPPATKPKSTDQPALAPEKPTLPPDESETITLPLNPPPTPLSVTDSSSATLEGSVMGTPHFMAPEQAEGRVNDLDARSDVFGLGGVLYMILTLEKPVAGKDVSEVLSNVLAGRITPPTLRQSAPLPHCPGGRVPEALSAVAMKALQVDPARRYQSVAYLQADLAAYQNGFATSAEEAGVLKQLQLLMLRHKLLATTAALMVLLTAGFMARVMASERHARAAEQVALTKEATANADRQKDEAALARLRDTAPTFHEQALALVQEQQLEPALEKVGFAIDLMPQEVEFRLLQGNLLQTLLRLDEAKAAYSTALRFAPTNAAAKTNLAFCDHLAAQVRRGEWRGNTLTNLLATLRQQERLDEAQYLDSYLGAEQRQLVETWKARLEQAKISTSTMKVNEGLTFGLTLTKFNEGDLNALKGMPLRTLTISSAQAIRNLAPLEGMPLEQLRISGANLDSIAPLKGLPLVDLVLTGCKNVENLSPLTGMPLQRLDLHSAKVRSLEPLRGMKLRWLDIAYASVTDLSPLEAMPLEYLDMAYVKGARDLKPLAKLPLRQLYLFGTGQPDLNPLAECRNLEGVTLPRGCAGMEVLRRLPKLRALSYAAATERSATGWLTAEVFWKAYDAEQKK